MEVIEKNHEKCELVQTTTWMRFEKQRMLQISKESEARGSSINLQHTESIN